MFSPKIQGFLYGVLITSSLVSVITYANSDGIFGDYFENIIDDATSCGVNTAITGFDATPGTTYGTQECTTFDTIVRLALGVGIAPSGQAVVGFDLNGDPVYGDVNWHKDGTENISYTGAGNVGIGTDNPTKTLSVSGVITADQYCISGTSECVKTFQQNLSNIQYFNFMNTNTYGGPGGTTNLLYADSALTSTSILPQGPVYMNVNSAMINAIGIDPSFQNLSNWFPVASSYMQAYEPYPRSVFVDQGDSMSVIIDNTINGPVAGNTNVLYCWIRRNSDGFETTSQTCDTAPVGWTIYQTLTSNPANNHGGLLNIEYKLITGSRRECDTVNWSSIMQNRSWGSPEITNVRTTSYQSAPSSSTYPYDYCGFDNMHSQIVARFHLIDYGTVTAGSLLQYVTDSPRVIKLKAIGISLLK